MPGLASIDRSLTPRARDDLAAAIGEADGNEVFFVGRPGPDGVIDEVEVHCRGNKVAVPALRQLGRPGDVVIHNHPSGTLHPSEPDLALASHFGQEGVGFFIVDNAASAVYVVVEPLREHQVPTDPDAVHALFAGERGLPSVLPGFEPRAQQIAMAQAVARAQNEGRVQIVEAGTGTGKSLAYLLPSMLRATANGERVAIATHTIHLQGQLLTNDTPIARRLAEEGLEVALVKGRGNYLCRRKLAERIAALPEAEPADRDQLVQIGRWAEASTDGSLTDLPFVPHRDVWESVQSSTEHTLRVKCPHYEECFYYASRRRAARAQILLVNHHLLFADLALKAEGTGVALLPAYAHVVLDEAHHLEDVATEFAGSDVTSLGLLRHLGRLRPARGSRRGLATTLLLGLDGAGDDDTVVFLRRELDALSERTEAARVEVRLQMQDVGRIVQAALGGGGQRALAVAAEDRGADLALFTHTDPAPEEAAPRSPAESTTRGGADGGGSTLRLRDDLDRTDPPLHAALSEAVGELSASLTAVARAAEAVSATAREMPEGFRKKHLQTLMDLASVQRRIVDGVAALGAALAANPDRVRWIELGRTRDGDPVARFLVRPIDVGDIVRDTLVAPCSSLVLTSATLSVAGGFEHLRARVGLDVAPVQERVDELSIDSPFDFARQALLGLPTDIPEPDRPGYEDAVVHAVADAIRVVGGRTFVLFTSYAQLRRVADRVGRALGRGWTVLRQGDLPRDQLLRAFVAGPRAALFGTDSFWEGVDVRGEALSAVILARLPFRVPSEPVQIARAERIEERGGNAFAELSVPQAVLKFRQGFGRLIRHRDDRGAVIVLDRRIATRPYGRRFLRSLPPGVEPLRLPMAAILDRLEAMLAGRGREVDPAGARATPPRAAAEASHAAWLADGGVEDRPGGVDDGPPPLDEWPAWD